MEISSSWINASFSVFKDLIDSLINDSVFFKSFKLIEDLIWYCNALYLLIASLNKISSCNIFNFNNSSYLAQ